MGEVPLYVLISATNTRGPAECRWGVKVVPSERRAFIGLEAKARIWPWQSHICHIRSRSDTSSSSPLLSSLELRDTKVYGP